MNLHTEEPDKYLTPSFLPKPNRQTEQNTDRWLKQVSQSRETLQEMKSNKRQQQTKEKSCGCARIKSAILTAYAEVIYYNLTDALADILLVLKHSVSYDLEKP